MNFSIVAFLFGILIGMLIAGYKYKKMTYKEWLIYNPDCFAPAALIVGESVIVKVDNRPENAKIIALGEKDAVVEISYSSGLTTEEIYSYENIYKKEVIKANRYSQAKYLNHILQIR